MKDALEQTHTSGCPGIVDAYFSGSAPRTQHAARKLKAVSAPLMDFARMGHAVLACVAALAVKRSATNGVTIHPVT